MYETLHEFLHRQPFRPFEIHLSNGNSYIVKHPEFVHLMKAKVVIGFPESDGYVVCFLLHLAEVRLLESA